MNAKEEVLSILNTRLKYLKEALGHDIFIDSEVCKKNINKTEALITAVENAIFDVPSVEVHGHSEYSNGFRDGINYILNYKKPETDE